MTSFVEKLFTAKSFDAEYPLITDGPKGKSINIPDGTRREQFVQWVESLPDNQTPSWLGLPNNAEKVLLTTQGSSLISKMLKMQLLEDDDDDFVKMGGTSPSAEESRQRHTSDGRPAWMRTLFTSAKGWLSLMPKSLTMLKRTAENIKDPLFRFFEREVNHGAQLLKNVRDDLANVVLVCEGKKKQTNHERSLLSDLAKGILPSSWNQYTVPRGLTVIQWVSDFSERIKQLQKISANVGQEGTKELKNQKVWLGGLFTPEAYITATRQFVAQANNWSLEELNLQMTISDPGQQLKMDDCSFIVTGLKLQGADCKENKLQLSSTIQTDLTETSIKWIRIDETVGGPKKASEKVLLPVYLNHTRAELLFTVEMTSGDRAQDLKFYERGVALFSSGLLA